MMTITITDVRFLVLHLKSLVLSQSLAITWQPLAIT